MSDHDAASGALGIDLVLGDLLGLVVAHDGRGSWPVEPTECGAMWEGMFGWLAIGAGVLAAAMWWAASLVRVPPFPGVVLDRGPEVFEPMRQALAKGARLNALAAGVTAGAALLQAASLAAYQLGR